MPEIPVTTVARITEVRGPAVFAATLPNGKPVWVHLPRGLAAMRPGLLPGVGVRVELTPYDFDHARISGWAEEGGEDDRGNRGSAGREAAD